MKKKYMSYATSYEACKIIRGIENLESVLKSCRADLKKHEHDLLDWNEEERWDGREACMRAIEIDKETISKYKGYIRDAENKLKAM